MRHALLLGASLLAAASGALAPELDPYRALSHDGVASAALLDQVREGLREAVCGPEDGAGRAPVAEADSGEASAASVPPAPPEWPGSPRPLYVTLVRGRATRACVGSDVPPGGSLSASLRWLGGQLATNDRRRPPVRAEELDTLRLIVAFAGDPTPVADPMSVDPMREGLKIETGKGTVAFLPGEARTVAWALREARRIGVLAGPVAEARCSKFDVVTLQGPATTRARRPIPSNP
ncbi:MAG: AMMECR1 domain-containing protein [Candidatus Eisenbacteria bacterium]|nr:AMMECR1 domain-containing protein [Candidatus Eisenbacteria bacterium]